MSVVVINKVSEPHGWFGNMSPHPVAIENKIVFGVFGDDSRIVFSTAEALFQALRLKLNDPATPDAERRFEVQKTLATTKNPMSAKMISRTKCNVVLRTVVPESIEDLDNMRMVLELKMQQHEEIAKALLETGDRLIVEDCTRRQRGSGVFWGAALIDGEWKGENMLGKLWMELRRVHV